MNKITKTDTGCCPPFNPRLWDNKTVTWKNKLFIKDKVRTFFYMPLNINCVMKRLFKTAMAAGAQFQDNMVLSDHTSKWNMDVYVAVNKKIKGLQNVTLSGKYYTRVYEGPHEDTKIWAQDFEKHMKRKKLKYSHLYMWYTTCYTCGIRLAQVAPKNTIRIMLCG
ncbi:MAG: hypothetical protein LBF37_00525 [Rickettsiales bacterium]|jgi:hypothetical protein|nr:hypothetical protein [Rickettsiales bacterium]